VHEVPSGRRYRRWPARVFGRTFDRAAGDAPDLRGREVLARAAVPAVMVAVVVASIAIARWVLPDRPPGSEAAFGRGGRPATSTAARGEPRTTPVTCGDKPTEATRELRGMWLASVHNIDWPSRPGLDAETVKAEYRGWLDLAQRLNHNAIFVQVRPSGDAFWPSKFAPWSEWLTGKRDGSSPGWDPLAFIVAETHARHLELHAWFNPYRGSQPAPDGAGADIAQLAPDNPLRLHPEWAVVYPVDIAGSRLYFNPGIPEARKFVEDAMLDAVARYDIDGVHFDDFFYPYPVGGQDFADDAAFARYGAGFASKADWRRDNVNELVEETGQRIKKLKPWVKFGISPFGIWRNQAVDPLGSPTRGLESYDDIYADTRLWVKREFLDYIVPQLYWYIGFDVADYAKLLPWWVDVASGTRVQLYVGQADYRVGQPGVWSDPAELERELALNHKYAVSGSVHFSAKDVRADRLGSVTRYRGSQDAQPALVPLMAQLPVTKLAPPTVTAVRRDPAGVPTLTWRAGAGAAPSGYAVYRIDAAGGKARLVAHVAASPTVVWADAAAPAGTPSTYCVTALDRVWNESDASAPRTIS
jgi:uncharacterized lipoprotein YddW (UPF0748 family)